MDTFQEYDLVVYPIFDEDCQIMLGSERGRTLGKIIRRIVRQDLTLTPEEMGEYYHYQNKVLGVELTDRSILALATIACTTPRDDRALARLQSALKDTKLSREYRDLIIRNVVVLENPSITNLEKQIQIAEMVSKNAGMIESVFDLVS